MKNSYKYILTIIFVFFCLTINAFAASKYIVLMDAVNLRKGPGTNYGIYKTASIGSSYYLKSENLIKDEKGCPSGWYQIDYSGSTAYVCSEYAKEYEEVTVNDNVKPSNTCQTKLANKGFTSTYFIPLCKLQEQHPNWDFEPIITGLDFNVVVDQESKCGKSYIETNNAYYMDKSCKSAYASTSIWKPASTGAVRYYLDPRNFFTDRYIFMFETLSYSSALKSAYPTAVSSVLKNAAFYQYHQNKGNNLSTIIDKVGNSINVSPTFIASRIYQEIGASSSLYNLYSGVYTGYENYYNFYNYGVNDSCSNGTTLCGLNYAKNNNWYGLEAAIKGGVTSISNSYIKVGQNTRYLQKFNVNPTNRDKLYTHQYMTNIKAPYGEASTAYNSYKNSNSLNASFTFTIPVYRNMPSVTQLPTSAKDNTSNGVTSSAAAPSGTIDPKSAIKSAGYNYTGNYITGLTLGEKVSNVINSLEKVVGSGNVTVKDGNKIVTGGEIGTGFTVTIKGKTTNTFNILIYGDISGDGDINAFDLLLVKRQIMKTENLKGAYLSASDINKDGKVSAYDLLMVQRHILRTESINQ